MSSQSWGTRERREGNQIGVPPTLIPYKPLALHPAALSALTPVPSRTPPRTTEQEATSSWDLLLLSSSWWEPPPQTPPPRCCWASPAQSAWSLDSQPAFAGGRAAELAGVSHGLGAASVSQAPFPLTRCLHVDLCISFAFLLFLRKMSQSPSFNLQTPGMFVFLSC